MITYRDMTFCEDGHRCMTKDCDRRLTAEDTRKAIDIGLPISLGAFAVFCPSYEPIKDERIIDGC